MKKYIKKIVSFVLCISLAMGIFTGVVMMPGNAVVAEAAYEFRTGENAKEVYRFLVCTMGFTPAAACGIMANIEYESGFQTNIYGDSHTSFGLCQWHDTSLNSGRMTALFNFCARNGYDVYSVEGQMRYLQYELINSGSFNETYGVLKGATNDLDGVRAAAERWCIYFEIPADRYNKATQRASLAQNTYWPIYGSITGVNACTVTPKGITETSAVLSGSVYKPLDVTIEENGIYFGSSEATMTKYRNDKFTGATNVYGLSFDFYTSNGGASTTLGVTLEPRTMYYYQFYCISGGVEYKGQLKSFTTALKTKSISIEQAEYDLEFDYEQWYENVYMKKNTNWSMPAVSLNYTVTPADTTDKAIWTSSDTNVATVSDGKVYVKDEGETVITVTSGDYSASCKIYTGRIFEPQLELRSKTQTTKQTSFVIGDTVQLSPIRYSSINYYYVDLCKVVGDKEISVAHECLSKLSDDKSDWWLENTWEFTPTEVGHYKVHMECANKAELRYRDFTFEVLDKSDEPIDPSISETGNSVNEGLGSLAGVSMSLDGYIIMNYYILPTDQSIGTDMSMQFTVNGQTQIDDDYDIAVVGDKVVYKYECRLAASDLTQNITAKLVYEENSKAIKTLTAYSYCKNIISGASSNASFAKAEPLVKSLMNYCGYAQIYFGKNTENIANSGLYSGVGSDVNPVLSGGLADVVDNGSYFAAYINGLPVDYTAVSNGELTLNGITYLGATLTLNSGTGLNLYYRLPSNMTETDLAGYTISIDGVGNISFVRCNTNFNTTVSDGSDESAGGEDADVEETDSEAVAADIEETDSEAVSTEVEEDECENIAEEAEVAETENMDDIDAVISENPEETVEDTSEDVEEDYTESDQDDVVVMQVGIEENTTEEDSVIVIEAEEAVEEAAEDTEIVSASVEIDNKTAITYTISDNILCISLVNISADKLGDVYSFKLKDAANNSMQINYSPIKYMIDMQNNGSDNGINLVRSLYLYYKAVEAYKG